ncbi:MAG: hypothetical protein WD872_04905 [Pirellulaceae bacterium]
MMRLLAGLTMVAVLGLLVTTTQAAEDKTHDGMVVSVAEGKLVMADKDGKNEHTHMIDAAAKVTLDGKAAKVTDLKKGDKVKVTTSEASKVTAVAATRSKTE